MRLTFKLEQDQLWIGTKGMGCPRLFLARYLWHPAGLGLGSPLLLSLESLHCALHAFDFAF